MVYAKCIPFDPLFSGVLSPEDLILYWNPVIFYHLSLKDALFCVKTPQISINMSPKDPTENTLIFCHEKTIPFLVNFVTERPLLIKCLMYVYVSLYKSCAPGYLHPLSILSQSTFVSPTEVLPRSILGVYHARSTTERYLPSRLHAKPSASTILAYA